VAGGVESMSQVEHYALGLRDGVRGDGVTLMDRLARARVTAGDFNRLGHGGLLSRDMAFRFPPYGAFDTLDS